MPRNSRKTAKKKSLKSTWGTTIVAWSALIIAVLALGIAVSEKPWFQNLNQQFANNLDIVMEEVRQSASSSEKEPTPGVEEAREAALDGDLEQMQVHISAAISQLRERSADLSEELNDRQRRIIRDLDRIRRIGEATTESAEKLQAAMEQIEDLQAEANSEEID